MKSVASCATPATAKQETALRVELMWSGKSTGHEVW